MTKMTHVIERPLLRRLRRIVLGVVAFYIATAIVLGVIDENVPLAVMSVTVLVVICIVALAFFRRLDRRAQGTKH
jgi:uncharacterized membrane protein YccC